MFLVFNKEKIYAYLVSIVTVIVLFFAAGMLNNKEDIIQASSTTERKLPIYNVNTDQKKIAFTMNCAWNADDIDKILEVLEQNNVHITFFTVGDWLDKYPEAAKKITEAGHEIRKPQ